MIQAIRPAFRRADRTPFVTIVVGAALLAAAPLHAQGVVLSTEDYLSPAEPIARILTSDAMHNRVVLRRPGPDGEHFLISKSGGMPSLGQYARSYVNLAETPIDPRANRSRSMTTGNTVGYEVFSYKTGNSRPLDVPAGITVSGGTWSPDGTKIAFMGHEDGGSYLFVANAADGSTRKLTDRPLCATLVTSLVWTWDSAKLLAVLVPADRGDYPEPGAVAGEPTVWVSHEGKTPSRTYRFLLKTPYDKELLEYLTTGQLALVDVTNGDVTDIGEPAMFTRISVSSDSDYFRVTTMQQPFSYFVPRRSFGTKDEFWDREGKVVHLFKERKLRVGSSSAAGGDDSEKPSDTKRGLTWRPDGDGMSFLQREPEKKDEKEAADNKDGAKDDAAKPDKKDGAKGVAAKPDKKTKGDQPDSKGTGDVAALADGTKKPEDKVEEKKKAPKRKDRVMQWLPPYTDESVKVVWESEDAIASVRYSQDCQTLYITQTVNKKRLVFAVHLAKPEERLTILETEASKESAPSAGSARRRGQGSNPTGSLMSRPGQHGGSVVRTSPDGVWVYLSGTDRPEDPLTGAPRPFVDRVKIGAGDKERLWQSAEDVYETLATPTDDTFSHLIVSRESPSMVPNNWLRDQKTGELTQLTHNIDPAPEVTAARRMRLQVTRVDGFKFWVKVAVPRDHGERLPALFWFYPREFTSQKAYDERQSSHNKNRFQSLRTRSMEMLTMLGYVVVQPDCPIVGEKGRMNDNFVADLRNSLWAVIDELDKREIIDRDRLAIGGHSYGAFGTANALAHTPFFKAGIAGDGNYNRTLTPMSFQSERRHVWDARETYLRMSPLLWANQVNGALLMYHGMDDNNSGTFPIHSPRMFQALDGLGKKVALYQYPYEGHGPRAAETILDLWSRWIDWLDIHVKHPDRGKPASKEAGSAELTETRNR